jgi:hypothetical protein
MHTLTNLTVSIRLNCEPGRRLLFVCARSGSANSGCVGPVFVCGHL